MRVLVTGGAGFIGSWTVDALVADGHDVVVYDSFLTGRRAHLDATAIDVVCDDICHPLAVQRAVRHIRPHAIIHLAACVSVPLSLRRSLRSHDANVKGTLTVLEAARANKVRRVVLASSAAVYGATSMVPVAEDAPLAPQSPYALQKRVSEDYARLYSQLFGVETIALRYFNVFGPRQDPASPYCGVIARFMEAARNNRSVTITGDGTQTRDFVFVADVARVNVAAVTAELTGHHVVNVATGHEVSLLALCQQIEAVSNLPLPYDFAAPRLGDIARSCADVSRLRTLFGLTCSTRLRDGLALLFADGRVRVAAPAPVTA